MGSRYLTQENAPMLLIGPLIRKPILAVPFLDASQSLNELYVNYGASAVVR